MLETREGGGGGGDGLSVGADLCVGGRSRVVFVGPGKVLHGGVVEPGGVEGGYLRPCQ